MKQVFSRFSRELGILAALLILVVIFGIIEPLYLTPSNFLDIIDQTVINGLMAVGITVVIITSGNDLSVGSTMAVVIVSVAKVLEAGAPPMIGILSGIVFGMILGGINGFLVAKMKLQPFIATMGTMSVYRGIAYVLTGGWPVLNMPDTFRKMMDGKLVGQVSVSVFIFIAVTALAYILLKHTSFGTFVYAMGSNEEATRLSGVKVDKNKIIAYMFCGVTAALAGMVTLAKLGTGEPTAGQGYELNAIAATAIGGTSLAGGKGSVLGTFVGAILLQALKVGLVVCGVDTFWQYIATGMIIILAVYFDTIKEEIKTWGIFKKIKREA